MLALMCMEIRRKVVTGSNICLLHKRGSPSMGIGDLENAFKRTRCLIPATGYYEWHTTSTGKQPYYFTAKDGSPLTIAGLWDEWKDIETGEPLKSCTMIITAANDFVSKLHDRMPVLLQPKDFQPWLAGDAGTELLRPADNDYLQTWPVSRRVNSSRAPDDDPTLIDRVNAVSAE